MNNRKSLRILLNNKLGFNLALNKSANFIELVTEQERTAFTKNADVFMTSMEKLQPEEGHAKTLHFDRAIESYALAFESLLAIIKKQAIEIEKQNKAQHYAFESDDVDDLFSVHAEFKARATTVVASQMNVIKELMQEGHKNADFFGTQLHEKNKLIADGEREIKHLKAEIKNLKA